MKLKEFTDLCVREWENGHGDVHEIWLPEDSFRELSIDTILDGAQDLISLYIDKEDIIGIREGKLACLLNPITRTTVRVHEEKPGAGPRMAAYKVVRPL